MTSGTGHLDRDLARPGLGQGRASSLSICSFPRTEVAFDPFQFQSCNCVPLPQDACGKFRARGCAS